MPESLISMRRAGIAVFVTLLLVAAMLGPDGISRDSSGNGSDAAVPGLLPAARRTTVLPETGSLSHDIWSAGAGKSHADLPVPGQGYAPAHQPDPSADDTPARAQSAPE